MHPAVSSIRRASPHPGLKVPGLFLRKCDLQSRSPGPAPPPAARPPHSAPLRASLAGRPCGVSAPLVRRSAGPLPHPPQPQLRRWEPRELPASFLPTFRHFCFCREREEEGGQREGGAPGEAGGEEEGRSGFGRLLPRRHPQDVAFQVRVPLFWTAWLCPEPSSGLIFRRFSAREARGGEVRRQWRGPCQCPRDPTSLGPELGFGGQSSWCLRVWGPAPRSTGTRRVPSSAQWVRVLPRDLRQPEERLGRHLAASARRPDLPLGSLGWGILVLGVSFLARP